MGARDFTQSKTNHRIGVVTMSIRRADTCAWCVNSYSQSGANDHFQSRDLRLHCRINDGVEVSDQKVCDHFNRHKKEIIQL